MKNNVEQILRDKKIKVTRERTVLLELLMSSGPVSIDVIYPMVQEDMNKTTVYRILDRLVREGVVYQTDFRDGKAYFEFQEKHHHHIVCSGCGVREDVAMCFEKEFSKVESKSKKFSGIRGHVLEFFGVCNSCQNVSC